MLVIRDEQMARLREGLRSQAVERMVGRVREHLPIHFEICGEPAIQRLAREALRRAKAYRLVTESGANAILDQTLRFGVDFDHDPQLPFIPVVLNDPMLSEPARIRRLERRAARYRDSVEGKDGEHLMRAVERFEKFPVVWDGEPAICFQEELLASLKHLFPQKCAYVGEARLKRLVEAAGEKAAGRGLAAAGEIAQISAVMLLAGSGALQDPRLPGLREAREISSEMEPEKRVRLLRGAFSDDSQRLLGSQTEVMHAVR